jgi:hypothetical protein
MCNEEEPAHESAHRCNETSSLNSCVYIQNVSIKWRLDKIRTLKSRRTEKIGYNIYLAKNSSSTRNLSFFLSFFLNRPLLPCGVEGFLLVNL